MGLIIETGIGAGIVAYGHLLEGAHGIAGEWGHNTIRGKKSRCSCGKNRCNEMFFSIPALEHFYERLTGIELPFEEITKRAEAEDKAALKTVKRLQKKFAEAVAVPINIVDPNAIVIGGAIGKLDLLYTEETRREILQYVFNQELKTQFLKPKLGRSACVFGAAMLTQQKCSLK
jgi:N-acetylglucosamine kinase